MLFTGHLLALASGYGNRLLIGTQQAAISKF
jgi:hypothetical protein